MTKLSAAQTRTAFAKAWTVARDAAARLGHAAREFFRSALLKVMNELRNPLPSQKEIVSALDMAARRAGERGATAKQTWFLAGLLARCGERAEDVIESGLLTRKSASFYIDMCLQGR